MFFFGLAFGPITARLGAQPNLHGEVEIRQNLQRLTTLGSVMMIGAHPDDENTALLAYFSRGRHMRTAYLSLTRGEGGQNLIGPEQGAELGVIRTEELLAARRIDGAEQIFTRAIDFGFSKTAADTFAKWPRDEVLGDIVWDIRRFRPDVIILRFSGTPRDGHGQHQASAILGKEAFSAAADASRYSEQLKWARPWQAKRLMYNVLAFTPEQEKEAAKLPGKIAIDVGAYNPELGYSYGEIAGMSRSQHRSQGMGSAQEKGPRKSYLLTIAGNRAAKDAFDGIDTAWTRLAGGASAGKLLDEALEMFEPGHPESLSTTLGQARAVIAGIDDPIAKRKLELLDETMALCAGLSVEADSDRYSVVPGGSLKISAKAIMRLPAHVVLMGLNYTGMSNAAAPTIAPAALVANEAKRDSTTVQVPEDEPYSQPYWLVKPPHGWMYTVRDPREIGDPENPPVLEAHFKLKMAGADFELERAVEYRYVDRVFGETIRPLAIVPPVAIDFTGKALVFPSVKSRRIEIPVTANAGLETGELRLEAPAGWKVEPASRSFSFTSAREQITAAFEVTPPRADSQGELRAVARAGDRRIDIGTVAIAYPHIPAQTLFPPAEAKLVRADIEIEGQNIGYVMGAGDQVPDALRQMGCAVALLSSEDLETGNLARFDAIVTGVRAFNVRADLRANVRRLFDYVRQGGTMVVQYNVPVRPGSTDASALENIGPYPMTIGRDRVTDPNAPVAFPNPRNPLLHDPNAITEKDFEGWVQERGLNFASKWDPRYQSVLESHDRGEKPHSGGELYTRYGKGVYVFSAYSWFRELPAGVPGAYRLFANMLGAGKTQ
ncbi:MAG: PIG-L family deacetylase [Bryobacteraceae bacterium]